MAITSSIWNVENIKDQSVFLAKAEAQSNWNKDQAFRRWATRHGGMYVVPDERTPPNPYLAHLPNRDIETTDGVLLTLMNPAYMMRQMTEEFEEMYGTKGKITGQILMNPLNEADPWELATLKKFDQGVKEVMEQSEIDGQPYIRLMRPMVMTEGCVKCHGHLGFKEGDIRGGVSVSVPLTKYLIAEISNRNALLITHGGVWAIGLVAIGFVSRRGKHLEIERTQTSKVLSENEAKLKLAVHTANLGYWHVDESAQEYLEVSEEYANIFGYTVEEFLKRYRSLDQDLELTHPEDRAAVLEAYALNTGWDIDYRIYRKDGSIGYVREIYRDSTEIDGHVLARGTLQDITDAKLAEQKMKEMQEDLYRKQRLATLGQLTATVSHELRNPLGAMRPSLYLIKKRLGDDADEKLFQAYERIDRNIDRCDNIIDELLDFTRITELEKKATTIDEWLESLLQEQEIPEDILLQKNLTLGNLELCVDSDRLRRVIINVMDNACQAMLEQSGEAKKGSCLGIKTGTTNERIEIVVSDTGTGIPGDILEKIFEPLFSTKTYGVGLGMPTVKQIMEQHDGGIEVKSEEGKGTTVTLWLPGNVSGQEALLN